MSKISSLQTEFESGDAKTSLKTTHKTTIIQILIWGALCGAMVYLNKVAALYMWKKADAIGANNMPLFDTFHDLVSDFSFLFLLSRNIEPPFLSFHFFYIFFIWVLDHFYFYSLSDSDLSPLA